MLIYHYIFTEALREGMCCGSLTITHIYCYHNEEYIRVPSQHRSL